jgi:hypothetical protein
MEFSFFIHDDVGEWRCSCMILTSALDTGELAAQTEWAPEPSLPPAVHLAIPTALCRRNGS